MFNEESVCIKCWNFEGDKTECSSVCKRREAYALHQPWYHIPPYGEVMAQKQEDTIPAPVKKVAAMKKPAKKKPVEQVKTWQEKYEYCSAATECLHCGKPKSKTNKLHAGLCKKTCSNRWRRNSILHPLYGEFISQNEIKMNWSEEKTQKIEARYNPQELHTVKEILDEEKRIEGRKENKMDFNDIVEHRIEQIRTVLTQKALEYATDQDRWHNFNRAGEILGVSPERALVGMMVKHFVSILDLVTWGETCPEKLTLEIIDEKINDNCNYLILLEGLLKKRIGGKQ